MLPRGGAIKVKICACEFTLLQILVRFKFTISEVLVLSILTPNTSSNCLAEYRKANFIVSYTNVFSSTSKTNLPFVGQVLCVCCCSATSHLLLLADHLRQDHTGQVTQPGGGLQDQVAAGQADEGVHRGAGQHY